jgi:hypothetical protein
LVFPIYFRTLDELAAPLKTDETLQRAFHIEHLESREVAVPFNDALAATGNRADWARSYTGFLRAFTEAILAAALPPGVSKPEFVERIYRRVEDRLSDDLLRYEFHYISVAMLLSRV